MNRLVFVKIVLNDSFDSLVFDSLTGRLGNCTLHSSITAWTNLMRDGLRDEMSCEPAPPNKS